MRLRLFCEYEFGSTQLLASWCLKAVNPSLATNIKVLDACGLTLVPSEKAGNSRRPDKEPTRAGYSFLFHAVLVCRTTKSM